MSHLKLNKNHAKNFVGVCVLKDVCWKNKFNEQKHKIHQMIRKKRSRATNSRGEEEGSDSKPNSRKKVSFRLLVLDFFVYLIDL